MPILIGDIVKADIAELRDIADLFVQQGKNESAEYLRGIATRYEMFFASSEVKQRAINEFSSAVAHEVAMDGARHFSFDEFAVGDDVFAACKELYSRRDLISNDEAVRLAD